MAMSSTGRWSRHLSLDDTRPSQAERWWRVISPSDLTYELGLERDYIDGFIRGFDDGFDPSRIRRFRRHLLEYDGREAARNFLNGVRDGVRVRRHVPVDIDRDAEELPF